MGASDVAVRWTVRSKARSFPLAVKEISMGLLDGILGGVLGGGGDSGIVADIAQKVGLTPAEAESAIGALAGAHPRPGDTVETASNATGLSPDLLQQVMGHLGGEGGLAGIASGLTNRQSS